MNPVRKLKNFSKQFAIFTVVSLIISSVFVFPQSAEAATFTFVQTDWSGGATANTAVHPINHLSLNYL